MCSSGDQTGPCFLHHVNIKSHRESKDVINTEINKKRVAQSASCWRGCRGLSYTWLTISASSATNHWSGVPSAALWRITFPEPCKKHINTWDQCSSGAFCTFLKQKCKRNVMVPLLVQFTGELRGPIGKRAWAPMKANFEMISFETFLSKLTGFDVLYSMVPQINSNIQK